MRRLLLALIVTLLWLPSVAAAEVAVQAYSLPAGGGPHDVAVGADGIVWYSESGVKPNTIVRFDPQSEKFQSWAIPGGGDIVRNMAVTRDGNPVMANSLVNAVGLVEIGE